MTDFKYLGNFSAIEPVYTRLMYCYDCKVSWHGCWDNFTCPQCNKGDLPTSEIDGNIFNLNILKTKARDAQMSLTVKCTKSKEFKDGTVFIKGQFQELPHD